MDKEEKLNLVKAVEGTKGNIAEVGVYEGDSAEVIAKHKGNRHLYLFDTFSGLPVPTRIDGQFHTGEFAAKVETVTERFKPYKNVHIIEGWFPTTAIDERFGLVHLDVDLYQPTKDCLSYFWPRLDGVIIVHDYKTECAVRVAVLEHVYAERAVIEECLDPANQVLIRK